LIGKNLFKSYDRPYDYVLVRHIPADPEGYSYYGENLLPSFGALPTWAYATPHNTQLTTPQTESCNSCHGNPDLFLTIDKIKPEEREANSLIFIDSIPGPVEEPVEE
jgi:thiosulfate/3-mercaptopyruvate sulfurtransferase